MECFALFDKFLDVLPNSYAGNLANVEVVIIFLKHVACIMKWFVFKNLYKKLAAYPEII
jgi:hypothetical protein